MKLKIAHGLLLAAAIVMGPRGYASSRDDALPNKGIFVDRIKMFSDADLRVRFRELASQLSPILKIDPAKVYEGLFSIQGSTSDKSSISASILTTPLPKVEDIVQQNFPPGTDPATGNKTTTTTDPRLATVPPSALPTGAFTPNGAVSQNALDRLSEYTQLFYETINLQILLNRAVSDAVTTGSDGAKTPRPRIPVILGIPVSIMAQPKTQGAMAQIWVSVRPKTAPNPMPINVITQIPQERTYNVSTITNNVSNVGLGAVTTLLNFGFSTTQQREKLYLVKSYDTIAISRFDGRPDNFGADFGWQIRPVLDNKNVTPGKRMLMVALSLPPELDQTLCVEVTTQWFRYDKKTGTVKEPLGKPDVAFRAEQPVSTKLFSPTLGNVELNSGTDNSIQARLTGSGFTNDLPYYSGGRGVLVSSNTDDRRSVQLVLNKDDLLTNSFQAGTMFGGLAPLQLTLSQWNPSTAPLTAFRAMKARAWEQSDDSYRVRLELEGNWTCLNGQCVLQIGDHFFGYELRDRPSFTYDPKCNSTSSALLTVSAREFVANKTIILAAPFFGFVNPQVHTDPTLANSYPSVRTTTIVTPDQTTLGFAVSDVKKTGQGGTDKDPYTIFTIQGRGLKDLEITVPALLGPVGSKKVANIRIDRSVGIGIMDDRSNKMRQLFLQLNGNRASTDSDKILLVPVFNEALDKTQNIILSKKLNAGVTGVEDFVKVQPLQLPPKTPDEVIIKSIDSVKQNHIGAVTVRGEGLKRVKKVLIGKEEVQFIGPETVITADPKIKEKVWYLVLPGPLTKTTGMRTVVFVLDDDTILTKSFLVNP